MAQSRRGTSTTLKTRNQVLLAGQQCYETDTYRVKIGDGITPYSSLAYAIPNTNIAAVNPTASDYAGYGVKDMWFNTTAGLFFICTAITGTTATWNQVKTGFGN